MKVGSLEIDLLANIARLQSDMNRAVGTVGQSMSQIERHVQSAQRVLASFGLGVGLAAMTQQVVRLTDEYTKYTAQLQLATSGQREYNQALADVRRIAKTAQADLASTGVLYARISNSIRDMGASQSRVADITETVNLALKVSGATASEAASATLQLSQAFASGVLRGEEFNAVNEAAPRLMKALADGIGVPVGALRKMAESGKLTSEVLSNVLPRSLAGLREEAKHVETIGGAFVVLKNEILEFVGTQAQASGFVSAMISGIELISKNLGFLVGTIATLVGSKLVAWLVSATTEKIRAAAAAQALRAATIAEAEADVVATTATLAQAAARKADVEMTRLAVLADIAVADGKIAAARATISATAAMGAQSAALRANAAAQVQLMAAEAARAGEVTALAALGRLQTSLAIQSTAATEAQTAATVRLAAAQGAASVVGRTLGTVMGFLGGPLGAILTVLGLGAVAWMSWNNGAKETEEKAAGAVKSSTEDILRDLDAQIKKLKERNALAGNAFEPGKIDNPDQAEFARIQKQMKEVQAGQGVWGTMPQAVRDDTLARLGATLGTLYAKMQSVAEQKKIFDDMGAKSKLTTWMEKYANDTEKMNAELEKARTELNGNLPADLEARIREKYGKKDTTAGVNLDRADAQRTASIMAQIAEQELLGQSLAKHGLKQDEINAGDKLAIQIQQQLSMAVKNRSGKLTDAMLQEDLALANRLAEQIRANDVTEKQLKLTADLRTYTAGLASTEIALADTLADTVAGWGQSAEAQKIASAQSKIYRDAEKQIDAVLKSNLPGMLKRVETIEAEADAHATVVTAIMRRQQAEEGAQQLKAENDRFAAESIIDATEREAALMEIEANGWRQRITLAGDGTEEQKRLIEQFNIWYANQQSKPFIDLQKKARENQIKEWTDLIEGVGDVFRDGFADMVNGGTDSWKAFTKSLATSFKTTVVDAIYRAFVKPLVVNLVANAAGALTGDSSIVGQITKAAGASGGNSILGTLSNGSSLYSAFTGDSMIGRGLSAIGSYFGGGAATAGAAFGATGGFAGLAASTAAANAGIAGTLGGFGAIGSATAPVIGGALGGGAAASGLALSGGTLVSAGTVGGAAAALGGGTAAAGAAGGATAAAGAASMIPVAGWAIAAALVLSSFIGSDKTPAVGGNGLVDIGKDGTAAAGLGETRDKFFGDDRGYKGPNAGLTLGLGALGDQIAATAKLYGGNAEGLSIYGQTAQSPDGQGASGGTALYDKNGTQIFGSSFEGKNEELEANVALSMKRALLGGLKASDLAPEFAAVFKGYGENLGTLSEEQIASITAALEAVRSMNTMFDGLSITFPELEKLGWEARTALTGFSGGLEALTTNLGSYYETYYSESERMGDTLASMTKVFDELSLKVPGTKGEFKSLVESLDLTTEAGQKAYATLLGMNQTFAGWADYAAAQAQAVIDKAKETADAQVQAAKDAADRITAIITAARDAAETAATDAMSGLTRSVNAQKDALTTAWQKQQELLQTGIDVATTALTAHQALSDRVKSTLNSMFSQTDAAMQRSQAQAQIAGALATARAGGGLPDVATLENALGIVSQPSQALFATFEDYQLDFLKTANDIAALGALTDSQLSIEERTLAVLKEQLKDEQKAYDEQIQYYDRMLENAQAQLDAALGNTQATLTVAQALTALSASLASLGASKPSKPAGGGSGAPAGLSSGEQAVWDAYQGSGIGYLDTGGWSFWNEAIKNGADPAAIAAEIAAINAGKNAINGSHANGLWNVPFDDYNALLHKEEVVLPAPEARAYRALQDMPRGGGNGDAALAAEVRELRAQVAELVSVAKTGNKSTARTADLLNSVTEGGNAMIVETIS